MTANIGRDLLYHTQVRHASFWKNIFPKIFEEYASTLNKIEQVRRGKLGYVFEKGFIDLPNRPNVHEVIKECRLYFLAHYVDELKKVALHSDEQSRGIVAFLMQKAAQERPDLLISYSLIAFFHKLCRKQLLSQTDKDVKHLDRKRGWIHNFLLAPLRNQKQLALCQAAEKLSEKEKKVAWVQCVVDLNKFKELLNCIAQKPKEFLKVVKENEPLRPGLKEFIQLFAFALVDLAPYYNQEKRFERRFQACLMRQNRGGYIGFKPTIFLEAFVWNDLLELSGNKPLLAFPDPAMVFPQEVSYYTYHLDIIFNTVNKDEIAGEIEDQLANYLIPVREDFSPFIENIVLDSDQIIPLLLRHQEKASHKLQLFFILWGNFFMGLGILRTLGQQAFDSPRLLALCNTFYCAARSKTYSRFKELI